jgi:RNA polymerase sigma-70 factor (ECF subfamily)
LRRRKIIECGISETREIAKYSATRDHSQQADPERTTAQREICRLTEIAIDALPEQFRIVIVARGIEGMSVAETAELLVSKRKRSRPDCTERVHSYDRSSHQISDHRS